MNNLLIISCIFGKQFKYVHPSPDNKNSYFFTNNKELKDEIINKGWNYVYVNKVLSDDIIISSLQCKYIKFLKFLDDFPQFQNAKTIIYFDHKENVCSASIDQIKLLINNNVDKSLIIRQTPSNKTSVYAEIKEAMGQPRYVKNMDKTKNFIKNIISTKEFSENVRICNTGLLIFINRENIKELLNNVYEKCIEHQQPECQIYWSIFSQKHKDKIKEIRWTDIKNIKRYCPIKDIQSKKIMIIGFPHCGTSILKSIIGHIEDVEEIFLETDKINRYSTKKYILCKTPWVKPNFFGKEYKDYIKIFIIRNPLFVYSSINRRYNNNIPDKRGRGPLNTCLDISNYIETLKYFIKFKNNISMDVYTIIYEDMFANNFQQLKDIFDSIGFQYNDNIFDNSCYKNSIGYNYNNLQNPPPATQHEKYRTYQINQKFKCYNDISNINLTKEQIEILTTNEIILTLYPEIRKSIVLKQLEDSFDTIYEKKMWTGNNKFTLSCPGSELKYAKNCIIFLINFIKEKNIRKIIDGSCGDCLWIMEVLKEFPDIEYIGCDISKKIININKEKYKKYSFYQNNILDSEKIPECDLFIFRHTMMHLSMDNNINFINKLKNNSDCFVFLTHHETKENKQGEPHSSNMSSLKWVGKNLHIKPFDIEEYLVDKFKECSNNSNEFGCIYKFNNKSK